MRDPNRIKPMLAKLDEIWSKSPDLRLGQLLYNIARIEPPNDIFNIEDGNLEHMMNLWKERYGNNAPDRSPMRHLTPEEKAIIDDAMNKLFKPIVEKAKFKGVESNGI